MRSLAGTAALITVLLAGSLASTGAADSERAGRTPLWCPDAGRGPLKARGPIDAKRFVGKTEPKATRMGRRHDCTVRVLRRDGEWLPGTADYRWDRANVAVRGGIVKRVLGIY
jgi:hypothetical protein